MPRITTDNAIMHNKQFIARTKEEVEPYMLLSQKTPLVSGRVEELIERLMMIWQKGMAFDQLKKYSFSTQLFIHGIYGHHGDYRSMPKENEEKNNMNYMIHGMDYQ